MHGLSVATFSSFPLDSLSFVPSVNVPCVPTFIAVPVSVLILPFPVNELSSFLAESTTLKVPFTVIVDEFALSVFGVIVAPQRSRTMFVPVGITTFSLVLANISILVGLSPYFSFASFTASSRVL